MISRRSFLLKSTVLTAVSLSETFGLTRAMEAQSLSGLASIPNAFNPNRATSSLFLDIANELFKKKTEKDESWALSENPWLNNLSELDDELRKNEKKARYARYGISVAFEPTLYALEFASTTAIAPASYVLWGIEKGIQGQKEFLLGGIEKKRIATGNQLARAAADILVDSRGLPYASLFPVGNPERARKNMEAAGREILSKNSALSGEQKSIILESMLSSMSKMYEEGKLSNDEGRQNTCECNTLLAASADTLEKTDAAAKKLLEAEDKLTKKGESLSKLQKQVETDVRLNKKIEPSTIGQIEDLARDVINAAFVTQDVVSAAVALGLSENTGASINKFASIASLVAKGALSFSPPNPMGMISVGSQLISSIFGKRRKGPDLGAYLQRIFGALSTISNQLVEVQRMQIRILNNVQTVQQNQIEIAQLIQSTIAEVQQNRRLIVDLVEGPLQLLSREVDRYGISENVRNGWGPSLSYADYKNLFAESGDILVSGIDQLEKLLANNPSPHAILQEATYSGRGTLNADIGDAGLTLNVVQNERNNQRSEYARRVEVLLGKGVAPGMMTEAANMMTLVFPDLLPVTNTQLTTGELRQPLIETGILLRMGWLTCATHHIQELLIFSAGTRRLMSEDELLNSNFNQVRGYLMLESVARWVDLAISQQLILGAGYERLLYLLALRDGQRLPPPTDFGPSGPYEHLIADLQLSGASLHYGGGNFDPRWVDEMHMIFARGHHENWRECQGYSSFDCEWYLGGGRPGYYDELRYEETALQFLESHAPLPVALENKKAALHLSIENEFELPDESERLDKFLGNQFKLELETWFGDFPLSPKHWPVKTVPLIAPWVRAQLNREKIMDRLKMEELDPHQPELGPMRHSDYQNDSRQIEECDRDQFLALTDPLCRAVPGWSNWNEHKTQATMSNQESYSFSDLDIYRDPNTGKFDPEVEALLDLKATLVRHLTPFRLYQTGDSDTKEKWIKSLRLQS